MHCSSINRDSIHSETDTIAASQLHGRLLRKQFLTHLSEDENAPITLTNHGASNCPAQPILLIISSGENQEKGLKGNNEKQRNDCSGNIMRVKFSTLPKVKIAIWVLKNYHLADHLVSLTYLSLS